MPIWSQETLGGGDQFEDSDLITIVETLPASSTRQGQLFYAKDTQLYWYWDGAAFRGPLLYEGDGHTHEVADITDLITFLDSYLDTFNDLASTSRRVTAFQEVTIRDGHCRVVSPDFTVEAGGMLILEEDGYLAVH